MADILEIHDQLLEYLLSMRSSKENLRFSLRRSNREGRLEDGYWFYGNDSYLAVSFWSGNDWQNRTPNIIFVILPDESSYLEFNVSDSKIKRMFVEQKLVSPLGMEESGQRFRKDYEWKDYMTSFQNFLSSDKLQIDKIVDANADFFEGAEEEAIGFILPEDFDRILKKTLEYKLKLQEELTPAENKSIKSVFIKGFGPIESARIDDIPENTQWIFLIGENGTGKTNVLRAISVLLGNLPFDGDILHDNQPSLLQCSLYSNKGSITNLERSSVVKQKSRQLQVSGFAAYGASRLTTNVTRYDNLQNRNVAKRTTIGYSLTNSDALLYDVLYKYRRWTNVREKGLIDDRIYNIRSVLRELIPSLNRIDFDFDSDPPMTWYIEEDEENREFERMPFHKLASGIRSMVSMFGDMMCRLFDQQPLKSDPAELTGVVLIDEIDLHLHPKLQKLLVEQLTSTFRKVQFIVTTHSPIPLLGAPANSCLFKVERNKETDVELINLTEIKVSQLMPNAILSSDLFDMTSLFARNLATNEPIRTEDYYKEIKINDETRERLKEIAKKLMDESEKG
jgi:predicted ATPase